MSEGSAARDVARQPPIGLKIPIRLRIPTAWLFKPVALSEIREWCVFTLWVIFIVGASSAARALEIVNVERFFWFPADVCVALLLFPRLKGFLAIARENKILLSWPALACLSTLWSPVYGWTLYHGLQLLMTVLVGFLLCLQADRMRVVQIVFTAMLCCQLLTLLAAVVIPEWAGIYGNWRGVFPHKNVLGMMMALQIITGTCLFLQGWHRVFTAAVVGLAVVLMLLSESGSSVLAVVVALSPLPMAFFYRRGQAWFVFAAGLAFLAIATAVIVLQVFHLDVVGEVLESLGKDRTLTGRTVLWDLGINAFWERPWLGWGYKGYWGSPDSTASYLRIVMDQNLWFFHNNLIEVAVGFGVIGPVVFLAGFGIGFARAVKDFAHDRQYISLWSPLFLVLVGILSMSENPLFTNHSLYQMLFVVAIVTRRENPWRVRHGSSQPRGAAPRQDEAR